MKAAYLRVLRIHLMRARIKVGEDGEDGENPRYLFAEPGGFNCRMKSILISSHRY